MAQNKTTLPPVEHSGLVIKKVVVETWVASCPCKWREELPSLAATAQAMADHLNDEGCPDRAAIFESFAEPK